MLFLAPIMLAGLGAIAVPVVIHLIDRSTSEAMDWPSLRFLKIARQQSARRSRLKNWLVLLARCLLLALVAVAFAKPYRTREEWSRPPNLPTTVVIVLDNSYSMGYREGAKTAGGGSGDAGTRFARAKELALQQLAGLALQDEAALVLANEQPVMLTDRPTRDLDQVRKLIQSAKLSDRGTAMGPALTAAFAVGRLDADSPDAAATTRPAAADAKAVTKPARSAWRHVVVFTDMQAGGWHEVVDQKLLEKTANALPVTLVNMGDTGSSNRFVRQVRVRDQTAGGMLGVEAEIAGQSGGGAAGEQVSLWIDGQRVGSPESIQSGSNKVSLRAPLPAAGVHACMVAIDEDRLPIDDHAYFAINVTGGSRLTLVDGDPSTLPAMSETYFLNTALDLIHSRNNALTIERMTPAQLSTTTLPRGGGLLLCNVPRLDGSALTRVENFLRGGGSVFVSLGDKIDAAHYNTDWHFLPIKLDKRLGDPSRARAYAVLVEQANHPLLESVDLAATRYFAFIGSDPLALKNGGRVLASFSNGSPFLVEGRFGGAAAATEAGADDASGGRVLLMTGPIDADWSNLPYRRAFVPLVDRLVSYLTRQRMSSRTLALGAPIRFSGPGTLDRKTITVTAPDGTAQTLTAAMDNGAAVADFRDTQSVGVYRVDADEGFATGGAFAVNLDTRESILTPIDTDEVSRAWGGHPLRIIQSTAGGAGAWNLEESPELTQKRTEYWPWLLLAAAVVFVIETALANFFTRRRRAEAPPTTEYLGARRNETMAAGGVTGGGV